MIEQLHNGLHIHLAESRPVSTLNTGILCASEHKKANRYLFAKDRQLYTTAHVFLRETLSRYAPIEPADWRFETNPYGKPAIANPDYQHLQFNLSHTAGLVAVAITLRKAVGVDIEQSTRNLRDLNRLSRSVFSASEVADVFSTEDSAVQRRKFFTYWTLKEAYIKARGMGLSLPLKKFWFHPITTTDWHLTCEPELHDQGERWLCHALALTQDYFLAYVVAASVDPAAIHIHLPEGLEIKI